MMTLNHCSNLLIVCLLRSVGPAQRHYEQRRFVRAHPQGSADTVIIKSTYDNGAYVHTCCPQENILGSMAGFNVDITLCPAAIFL